MQIGGFMRMTVLDYPTKVAATVFTHGCNLRCPFCHNARLVVRRAELLAEAEVLSYLEKRRGVLDGVCVSGGEPLLQADLFDFLARVRALGYAIKLDTNGTQPERLRQAVELGLVDYVAMDIKNSRAGYARTVGLDAYDTTAVEESVSFLLSNAIDYELRTTVVSPLHTEADFIAIGQWIAGAKRYFLQGFTDSGDLICADGVPLGAYSRTEMEHFAALCRPYVPSVELRGV